jgi:sigma-B regulation protein RsbU (phosphoserine phosphatase)
MYISGAIRMASTFQIKISSMMKRLNQLVNKIFSDDRFISLFYGEVSNDSNGLFLYANAGHNPPMFLKRETNEVTCLTATGPLLGPAPHSSYKTDSVNFDYGDILVIYSDGITEAADDKFEFYEEERLKEIIIKNKNETPKKIALNILEDVQKFSTLDSKYQDDKTIVVIQRKFKDE